MLPKGEESLVIELEEKLAQSEARVRELSASLETALGTVKFLDAQNAEVNGRLREVEAALHHAGQMHEAERSRWFHERDTYQRDYMALMRERNDLHTERDEARGEVDRLTPLVADGGGAVEHIKASHEEFAANLENYVGMLERRTCTDDVDDVIEMMTEEAHQIRQCAANGTWRESKAPAGQSKEAP